MSTLGNIPIISIQEPSILPMEGSILLTIFMCSFKIFRGDKTKIFMKKYVKIILISSLILLCGCKDKKHEDQVNEEVISQPVITDQDIRSEETTDEVSDPTEPVKEQVSLINADGSTLEARISVPEGYKRTEENEDSLGKFLRSYAVLPDKSPVLMYDGSIKANDSAVCVFDMYLGDKDLQQCADSVMRVYAEYMRASSKEDKIAFHFVSGFLCDWTSYKNGKRIVVNGNDVSWNDSAGYSESDETFENYLNTVFNYASTLSLEKESKPIDLSQIKIGDIFIKGGSPGHVVMVVDTCEKDGKKAFLLAQGYMPAQQFHVLINEEHEDDPWYYEDEIKYPFITPEYIFMEPCLRRPGYLDEKKRTDDEIQGT